ncbi:GHKL domain-containing protein [Clostridium sp. MCC353]|uniref:sensor histidine kinase n=1 Tax=Clostridium sp. MCC353 TaxID=2592646 RepID=UPI001C02A46F|nr:sensor histidine kinase [Clostridium sp. MCC353]MBT9777677.1 GHKL domain-containing protein [Clostridium sp. MCC353]
MDSTQVFRFFFDAAMVAWFALPVQQETDQPVTKKLTGWCFLLFLLPIYLYTGSGNVLDIVFRFLMRALAYSLWIRFNKGLSPAKSLYFGVLCWITFTCENNIFLTPQLSAIRWNQISYGLPFISDTVINRSFEFILELFLITLVSRLIPLDNIRRISRNRVWLGAALIGCELYVKYTLKLMSMLPSGQYPPELTIYPILMQLLTLMALIMFERYLYHRDLREAARLGEAINRYRYENALTRLVADDDLRRLHHDLKNHLIVLHNMIDDNQNAGEYILKLMQGIAGYERLVETGNKILNGLLSEKIQAAEKEQIDVNACFDFRTGAFIDDLDVCAIFGNAMDNAIEASRRVKDPEKRCILVKCSAESENLVISFMNYFEGDLNSDGKRLLTTKTGHMHGIGLSSIQRSVEKYGGTMVADTDDFHNFILTVLIPIPTKT